MGAKMLLGVPGLWDAVRAPRRSNTRVNHGDLSWKTTGETREARCKGRFPGSQLCVGLGNSTLPCFSVQICAHFARAFSGLCTLAEV